MESYFITYFFSCFKNVGLFKPQNIQSLFLFYFFQSPLFQEDIQKKLGGSTQKFLALGTLRELTSPLPPLKEQKEIAEILSTQDKEIHDLEKKLELFKQQKKGLMQILLTGRVRV
jgi:type I restriction enzyme S subunit